jgi:hypothetical protein
LKLKKRARRTDRLKEVGEEDKAVLKGRFVGVNGPIRVRVRDGTEKFSMEV